MITFTEQARKHVVAFLEEEAETLSVRIRLLDSSPLAPRYDLSLIEPSEREPDDEVYDLGEFEVVIDAESALYLSGATVGWVETIQGSGFKIENPNIAPLGTAAEGPLAERVKGVIDLQINPSIAAHGGQVSLVEVRDGVAYVEMSGGCQGCGMAAATLTQGVRRLLMEIIPEIQDVVDVTDHAAGVNPYY